MALSQNKKFPTAVFEPLLGFVRVGCEAAGQRPECTAVVGVGEVAEFVYADIVGNVFRCADQPPVEAYACGFAAHAPEGFGRGQRGGGGEQLCGAGMVFEAGKQVALGPAVSEKVANSAACLSCVSSGTRISDGISRICVS